MIDTGDLRKGLTIELDGQLYSIMEYEHIKMGRGSAQVRIRLKDVRAGHITERTFQAGHRFPRVFLERQTVQFLYQDGDLYNFMNVETYEQTAIGRDILGDAVSYVKEGMEITLLFHGEEAIGVELPTSVDLKIVDTGPGIRGDTAQGGTKPATLETGLVVQVPLFVNNGEVIRVDTRSGQYIERAG